MPKSPTRPQHSLFDWFSRAKAPRGAISLASQRIQVDSDELRELHRGLERGLGTVDLVVTDNTRRMVTARARRGRHHLRLHHMFVGAPPEVVDSIVDLARGDGSGAPLRDFIADNRDAIKGRAEPSESKGAVHDLDASLQRALREEALRDAELDDIVVGWGRNGRGRRSIRFGTFDFDARTIRIHPALDEEWVPAYFVDFVMYHELLHALFPPTRTASGRRVLHPPEFRRLEKRFSRYEDAMEWETANLGRLLKR